MGDDQEHHDSPSSTAEAARRAAGMIAGSKHLVVFTGAGISTSCGISDSSSTIDTCMQTLGGTRELRRRCQTRPSAARVVAPLTAKPSFTHMALVRLCELNRLQHVISLNTDGVHRRSGLPRAALSELHGNTNLERCSACGMEVFRDFRVRNMDFVKANCPAGVPSQHFHATGRTCPCGGMMMDSVVNADEDLAAEALNRASAHVAKADVLLVLGSSLQDARSASLVVAAKRRERSAEQRLARALGTAVADAATGNLVICNLQKTPLDSLCDLRVHAQCDEFMGLLMQELEMVPAELRLRRRISVRFEPEQPGAPRKVFVRGLDHGSDVPFTYIVAASFESLGVTPASVLSGSADSVEWVGEQPATTSTLRPMDLRKYGNGEVKWWAPGNATSPGVRYQPVRIHLKFNGNCGETDFSFDLPECFGVYDMSKPREQSLLKGHEVIYSLEFDPHRRTWKMEPSE